MTASEGDRGLKVGLIGLRHLHPRAYMPVFDAVAGLKVVAAAESNDEVREAFTGEFRVRGYHEWSAMIEGENLDLAAIFLPHVDCPDAAVACAERGLHVLVEKPMAASAEGLRRIIAATKAAGVTLTTPYVWRCHPVARQMKQFIEQGVLGRVAGCQGRCAAGRVHRYVEGSAGWMLRKALSGGGPMYNLGVHWVDLFRWLLDDEVVEVAGKNVKINQDYDIEDNSFAMLTFSSGAVLALDISYTVPESYPHGRDLHLGLRGTSGMISWSPSFEGVKESLFVCSDVAEFSSAPRRHLDFEIEPCPGYAGVMGVQYFKELVESLRTGSPPAITGEDGLRALEVVEAIYESAESGRSVRLTGTAETRKVSSTT